MKLLTAKVIDGQVHLPPGTAEDGVVVTLLVPDDNQDDLVELTGRQRALLLESVAQADRGEVIDGWDLLEQIRPA